MVREDYQDKDDKLKKFVSIYQNSAQVQQALNEDFLVQNFGFRAGNKESLCLFLHPKILKFG